MLQSIRDRAQGWLMWAIIIVLGLAFGFWGVARFVTNWSSESSPIVANINGQQITVDQFNNNYERLKRQLQLEYGSNFIVTPTVAQKIKQQTVQNLIADTVLTQAAADQGYRITTQQIDTVLASMPIFQVNGIFSADRFNQVLNTLMYTESDFLTQLRTDMLLNQVQMGLINSAFTLPSDINNAYRLVNQTRDVQFFIIPHQLFANKISVTNKQIAAYYDKNKAQFKIPEQVSLSYVSLNLPTIQNALKFSDADLKFYYQANLANYKMPAQWQVAHILVAVPSNATASQEAAAKNKIENLYDKASNGDFAELAKNYSDDTISARNGGVLPWFGAGSLGTIVQNAINNLKVNQVSKPTRTQYGYEIYKLLAIKPAVQLTFEQAKNQVNQDLSALKAQQMFADQSQQLSNITYSNPDSLSAAAKALNLSIQTTPLFTRAGSNIGLAANPKIVAAAFSSDVLAQGDNSDLIQVDPNTVVVIHILQHIPEAIKPLKSVAAVIKTTLQNQQEANLAKAAGQRALAALQAGKTLAEVASNNNAKIDVVNNATRHTESANPLILNQAFFAARPKANSATYSGLSLPNGDYTVLAVTNIKDGDVSKMSSNDKLAYQQQLAANYGHLDFELYVRQQMAKSKIKVDNAAISAQITGQDQ